MTEILSLTEDQRDCLQEIVNVAMGQAGDSLARFLEVFVHLSVPRIRLVGSSELPAALTQLVGGAESICAVRQGFYSISSGKGMRGEALVIFGDKSFKELAELLAYEDDLNEHTEKELLLDVTNVLTSACLNRIGEQIETELAYSSPSILGFRMPPQEAVSPEKLIWSQALLVEIHYTLEKGSFSCNLMLLMPEEVIEILKKALDHLLESFE
jgi:chemotaxis protein CheC